MATRTLLWTVCAGLALTACVDRVDDTVDAGDHATPDVAVAPTGTTTRTPIGLALDLEDGVGQPLSVRANQTFYINQIDMRAHLEATTDEGVAGLARQGDFAGLDWRGTASVDESFVSTPNADGTMTRRRFYRQAVWMDLPSAYVIEQLDARGLVRGLPVVVADGLVDERTAGPADTFFARRVRGIQWANNCASRTDCATATDFTEEALVELRYANGPQPTFQLDSHTTQLRVLWTANPRHLYTIPVTQVAAPQWDYGFDIHLAVTTPAQPDGTYLPGQTLNVAFTFTDASGTDLAPGGALPTFQDYATGTDAPGIDYWNEAEAHITYYRRKHRERQMLVSLDGPMQSVAPLRTTYDFVGNMIAAGGGTLTLATPSTDGFVAEAATVPNGFVLLGVLPPDSPVGNTVSFTLPADAPPGTYKIAMKARRTYLGQDIPSAAVLAIQVGTTQPTHATLGTGNCTGCHHDGDALTTMSHGFAVTDREVCTTCHAPLPFEPEGPIYVRVHFIHSRSGRLDASPEQCSLCHTSNDSIQRTSQSACMSCHKSYPADHVAKYGPITDMFTGGAVVAPPGTADPAFQPCTASCHRTHPRSGL